MQRSRIGRRIALSAQVLAGAALLLPIASQAKSSSGTSKPVVSTGNVAHASAGSATLDATVDPQGLSTSYYFQYGPTIAYGSQTAPGTLSAGSTKIHVGQEVKGLVAGYHYRIVATNADGTSTGRDRIYTVKAKPFTVTLARVSGQHIVGSSLVLTGSIAGAGNAGQKVQLESSPYPYTEGFSALGTPQTTTSAGTFSFTISHLTASTQFRVNTLTARPAYSKPVTVPAVRVALHVRTLASHPGIVRLYGTVSPAQVGARVALQLQKPPKAKKPPKGEKAEEKAEAMAEENPYQYSTQFSTTTKRATQTVSRFSVVVKVRHAGHYRALVEVRKGPLGPGYSSTVSLRAAPSKRSGSSSS